MTVSTKSPGVKRLKVKPVKVADRPAFISLEARLTREEADSLATRIPKLQKMLQAGVLFFRDSGDRDDLVTALNKIGNAIAAQAECFETHDWPPRPAPKHKGKPRPMGARRLKAIPALAWRAK